MNLSLKKQRGTGGENTTKNVRHAETRTSNKFYQGSKPKEYNGEWKDRNSQHQNGNHEKNGLEEDLKKDGWMWWKKI